MGIVPSTNRPRVKEAVDRFVARVRHNIDVHLDTLAGDLVKAIEEDGGKVSADGVSDLARAASALQTQEGKLDMLAKLVGAMRLQDDATTLRGILEALARGGSTEAARVAVMLVDGSSLHSFADYGFLAGVRPTDTPLESYSAIAAVVRDRQRLVLAAPPGARLPEVPPFMRAMSGNSALVVPVIGRGRRRGHSVCRRTGASGGADGHVGLDGAHRSARSSRRFETREHHLAADG